MLGQQLRIDLMIKPRLFFCYSKRLKRALVANGFKPICVGINQNTNALFWLFWGDEIQNYKDNIYPTERDKF